MNKHQPLPAGNTGAGDPRLPNQNDLTPDESPAMQARSGGFGTIEVGVEIEPTRTQLSPAAELLGAVVAQAAADCRRALKRKAQGKFQTKDLPLAASACRFFLSESGHSMIHACGMGHEGIRAGVALAQTTIRRLGLSPDTLLRDPEESWKQVVARDDLAHAAAMNRPKVAWRAQEPLFRLVA